MTPMQTCSVPVLSRISSATWPLILALAVAACGGEKPSSTPENTAAAPAQGAVNFHSLKSTQDFRSLFKTTGYIPERAVEEFEDRQPLDRGGAPGEYGPYVQLATNAILSSVTDPSYFDNPAGQNVALALLESATVPKKYEDVGLKPVSAANLVRCYYVRRIGTKWYALVFEGDVEVGAPYKSCSLNRNPAPSEAAWKAGYSVAPEKIIDVTTSPPTPFAPGDYLNSGAFEEANGNRLAIGFRCADAWCHIGVDDAKKIRVPDFVTNASPPPGHGGGSAKHSKRSLIRGWFDDQELGVNGGTSHAVRAQIVPEDNIGRLKHVDFAKIPGNPSREFGQLVAQIYLPDAPTTGSKYALKGLQQGWNELWLGNTGGNAATYEARVRPVGATTAILLSGVTPHVISPRPVGGLPGSARWAWIPGDEGVWVPCDDGCCEVSF